MEKHPTSQRNPRARNRRSPQPESTTSAAEQEFEQRDTVEMPAIKRADAELEEEGEGLAEADPDTEPSSRAPEL
jgi:hypothetical protein